MMLGVLLLLRLLALGLSAEWSRPPPIPATNPGRTAVAAFNDRVYPNQRPRHESQSTKSSSSLETVFSEWSKWSVCDNKYCTQNRVRRCKAKNKCGNAVIRDERPCVHEGSARRRRSRNCNQQYQQRAARRKAHRFHIVQVPEKARPRHGRGKDEDETVGGWFGGHYGKWSKWSECTKSCTTHRRRWCRMPGFCWKEVIRQSAYCYVEGSYCQKWISRIIRNNYEDASGDRYDLSLNGIENSTTKEENNWKCGVSRKNSGLAYLTRIIGGRPTAPGSWPWQVAVLNRYGEAFCGGTLVSPRWVLTAAHCVRKRLSVRIGEYNLSVIEGSEIELKVDYSITHPKYNAHTVDNDIALLRLPVTLTPSDTRGIACLPTAWQDLPSDQLCTIIGWGKSNTSHEFGTDVLHEARIPIVSDEMCRNVYVDYKITSNMFCAGYRRGRMDSCAGDSGGPLLCKDPEKTDHPWTVFGITSFGEGCGKRGKYGIYARLSNYVNWIVKTIKQTDAYTVR
ncbi:plasma kallikrein [Copidosoma floridanum]|uniref:plasma kallikrein n=2 Tax=Copidosoma floridanum TaxID=29053 RepID=UPI0006C95A09|nr:plasma kallikrein [Copidosoma floridanum]